MKLKEAAQEVSNKKLSEKTIRVIKNALGQLKNNKKETGLNYSDSMRDIDFAIKEFGKLF